MNWILSESHIPRRTQRQSRVAALSMRAVLWLNAAPVAAFLNRLRVLEMNDSNRGCTTSELRAVPIYHGLDVGIHKNSSMNATKANSSFSSKQFSALTGIMRRGENMLFYKVKSKESSVNTNLVWLRVRYVLASPSLPSTGIQCTWPPIQHPCPA